MKLLSIDVGIKNLAVCVIEFDASGNNKILEWVIINSIQDLLDNQLTCCVTKKGVLCKKVAVNKVILGDKVLGFCHLKNCQKEVKGSYSKKQIKKYKKINANHIALSLLGKNIYHGLNSLDNLLDLDFVIIENQPVLKNPKMKSVQMIIYSYFLFSKESKKLNHSLILFNARSKLKIYDGPEIECKQKNKYSQRKFLSVEYTKYFLNKNPYNKKNWSEIFSKSKKQDDLADSYLQALTYYHKNFSK